MLSAKVTPVSCRGRLNPLNLACNILSRPNCCSTIASRIHSDAGSNRKICPTCRISPPFSASSVSFFASLEANVIGFSTNTSFPISSNSLQVSKCAGAGVTTTAASTFEKSERASVAHSASRWRSYSGDEGRYRFFTIPFDPLGGFLFGRATNFADQNHRHCADIFVKQFHAIEMRQAVNRIAAYTDAG